MFAALRSVAALAAQIQTALTLRTIAEAADEHWDEATKRCAAASQALDDALERRRLAADRLAEEEAEQECWEPKCPAALNIAGAHFNCDMHVPHDGRPHGNTAAQAIWDGPATGRRFVLEQLAEDAVRRPAPRRTLPRQPVYPGSNPLNHQTSATEGEAPAPHGGPSVAESPASSVSADLDDAGPPALTRSDLHNAAFTARIFATNQPHSRDRDHWAQLAARIQHTADAIK